jgi:DNA polymerase III delta subunit
MWRTSDAFFSQVQRMPLAKIAEAMKLLAQIDHDIKTGRAQPQIAAEQLVFKLATQQN